MTENSPSSRHWLLLAASVTSLLALAVVALRPSRGATAPAVGAVAEPLRPAEEDERNRRPIDEYKRQAGAVPALASPRELPTSRSPVTPPPPRALAPPPARPDLPMTIALFEDTAMAPPAPTADPPTGAAPTPAPSRPVSRRGASRFLAFGEPVKCALVFAVASDSTETPVVGMVTEDRYFDGRLVIPKGTKVHGTVGGLTGPSRARKLRTGQRWTLVFPQFAEIANGAELTVRATALNRAETGPGAWAVADGDGGLRGVTLYDPAADRIREFATAFLASAASGLQSTVSVATREGTTREVESTPRNAALGGVSAVLASEVARIQDEIRANGAYVFVPSGTTFYLYPLQAIDLAEARRGDASPAPSATPSSAGMAAPGTAETSDPARPEPVPIPSAYGRGPYDLTRRGVDAAVERLRPNSR
ncbi:MAG: TrbI/VirB10 family protein [Verrucomicrobia bacterium]|nr:TrbI/VirB10 family protein [Verrucomicrobiota bacterium]